MRYSEIKNLFRRYLSGQADDDDKRAVEQWYERLEERPSIQLSAAAEKELEAAIWRKLEPRLIKQRRSFRLYAYVGAAAASIALIIFAGIKFISLNEQKSITAPQFQEYVTGTGQRKQLTLKDGTVIALNSATHLRIYQDDPNIRKVEITDGEAFFKVRHDPAHPFLIISAGVITRVLGTSFNIRAYKGLEDLSVAVLEGKVQVADSVRILGVLQEQQKLVFNQHRKTYAIQPLEGDVAAWQQGKLLFRNTSFEEMAQLMHKSYGIYIQSADNRIKQKKFTATLPLSLSAVKAAEVLASIHQFKIKQRRDTIELYH